MPASIVCGLLEFNLPGQQDLNEGDSFFFANMVVSVCLQSDRPDHIQKNRLRQTVGAPGMWCLETGGILGPGITSVGRLSAAYRIPTMRIVHAVETR